MCEIGVNDVGNLVLSVASVRLNNLWIPVENHLLVLHEFIKISLICIFLFPKGFDYCYMYII